MLEAVIIGAGPAGSLCAGLLARRGIRVRLIEQHRFPRDKVCGECVSALGWDVLERVGLAERVRQNGAQRMWRGIVYAPSGSVAELKLPAAMWGISRSSLDSVLLEASRDEGVEVLQPVRVEGHGRDARGNNWVRVRHLETNSVENIGCDVVIVADGKGATFGGRPGESGDFGIKAHFQLEQCPRDTVQLFGVRGCYGGVAPIEDGLFNIACSVPRARIERFKDVEAVFAEMMSENRGLADLMHRARRVSPWLASPLPRFGVRSSWPPGVIPIGNAAAALEPIGGEGMGLALRSAELAAEAISTQSGLSLIQQKLQQGFIELWRWRRLLWRGVAMLISRPILCELAVDVMNVTNVGERLVAMAKAGDLINESASLQ